MKYHPYVHYILVKYLFPPTITCYYKADIRNPLRYLLMNKSWIVHDRIASNPGLSILSFFIKILLLLQIYKKEL